MSLRTRSRDAAPPAGAGPFPVLVLLHGQGEFAQGLLRQWGLGGTRPGAALARTHVLVAPQGDRNAWNVLR